MTLALMSTVLFFSRLLFKLTVQIGMDTAASSKYLEDKVVQHFKKCTYYCSHAKIDETTHARPGPVWVSCRLSSMPTLKWCCWLAKKCMFEGIWWMSASLKQFLDILCLTGTCKLLVLTWRLCIHCPELGSSQEISTYKFVTTTTGGRSYGFLS